MTSGCQNLTLYFLEQKGFNNSFMSERGAAIKLGILQIHNRIKHSKVGEYQIIHIIQWKLGDKKILMLASF